MIILLIVVAVIILGGLMYWYFGDPIDDSINDPSKVDDDQSVLISRVRK